MAISVRDEGSKVNSNINVTPMVDVMLVLLIIFMVITPMVQNKVTIDLPKAETAVVMPDADKDDAIVVAVTRDGQTYVNAEQVALDDIGHKVADKLENKTSKQVYFRGDVRAPYGKVMDTIDSIRTAGVEELGLLADQKPPTNK
jgi:biopolymer transport protein ExbD/biopolymer transport protein TolR